MEENQNKERRKPRSQGTRAKEGTKINVFKLVRNIIIVIVLLVIALFVLEKAPNYKNHDITDKTNLVINNSNVTAYLKNDLIVENNHIYLSRPDVANFFDPYLYYNADEKRIVITYDTKVTNMFLDNTLITINDVENTIDTAAFERDETVYIPISQLLESLNIELNYYTDTNIVTVDTLSREQIKATATKNLSVKSMKDTFSRTVAKIKKDEQVIVIEKDEEKGWTEIRTSQGVIGYVKSDKLTNETVIRTEVVTTPQIEGKVNMVWEPFYTDIDTTYIEGLNVFSPMLFELEELGKGNIIENINSSKLEYLNWAKSNNYKVWAMVTNHSMIETTSEILNSYELRNKTINNILKLAQKYDVDGINLDFEHMYEEDKDLFTQFVVELYPRLKELGMVLSVDVTAPDGGSDWSMCYDRNAIADNCDYIVFMAYDQYGSSSTKAGTTAGLDWMRVSLNKFLTTEEIEPNKIILGLPFFTRLWTEYSDGSVESAAYYMKSITNVLPTSVYENRTWLEDVAQYYVEYAEGNVTKKMWIEDERSLTAKLNLVMENNLGGVAFWAKGYESPEIWSTINNILNQ